MADVVKSSQIADEQIHVGSETSGRDKLLRLASSKITLAAVLIILLAIGFFVYRAHQVKQFSHQQLTNIANSTRTPADSAKALKILNGQKQQTRGTLLIKAQVYENAGNSKQALAIYQQVVKQYGDNYAVEVNMGSLAQQTGNKPLAIRYYQQAINLLKHGANDPTGPDDIQYYQQLIQKLQAS